MLRLLPTTILFLTAAFLSFATHLQADIAVFDFEGAPGDGVHDGDLSTLSLTESGLTVTITRTSGLPFDVLNDVAGGFPDAFPAPGWDDQALSPFFAETANDRFLVNFSLPVDLFGVQTGDFGGDDDDLILQAFSGLNGTGTLIDTTTDSFTGDFNMTGPGDGPQNLVVFGSGTRS